MKLVIERHISLPLIHGVLLKWTIQFWVEKFLIVLLDNIQISILSFIEINSKIMKFIKYLKKLLPKTLICFIDLTIDTCSKGLDQLIIIIIYKKNWYIYL